MKKVLGIALALALALALSVAAFAAVDAKTASVADAQKDLSDAFAELSATYGQDQVKAAVEEALGKLDLPADAASLDAADLPAGAGTQVAQDIIAKLGVKGDLADKIEGAFSNDFVSFIAAMYTGVEPPITTTKVAPPDPKPDVKTGDSATIAIATFATLSAAAAVAFVCLKKKDK